MTSNMKIRWKEKENQVRVKKGKEKRIPEDKCCLVGSVAQARHEYLSARKERRLERWHAKVKRNTRERLDNSQTSYKPVFIRPSGHVSRLEDFGCCSSSLFNSVSNGRVGLGLNYDGIKEIRVTYESCFQNRGKNGVGGRPERNSQINVDRLLFLYAACHISYASDSSRWTNRDVCEASAGKLKG